jgi:group I intron endonuclease
MGWFYKIINKTNNKIYFGITRYSNLDLRYNQHIKRAYKEYEKFKLQQAIKKYGKDNFCCIGICQSNNWLILCKLEIYFISKYNTQNDSFGYNMTKGGDGVIIMEKTIKQIQVARQWMFKFNNEFDNPMKNPVIIKNYFSGKNHPYYKNKINRTAWLVGRKERTIEQSVKVNQICVKTGKILNTFNSIKIAAEKMGLKNSTTISDCLNNRQLTSKGFKWEKVKK